jgi:hypothetical protein
MNVISAILVALILFGPEYSSQVYLVCVHSKTKSPSFSLNIDHLERPNDELKSTISESETKVEELHESKQFWSVQMHSI